MLLFRLLPAELAAITNYRHFWLTQTLSFMANQILMMAFGWHIYQITHDALSLGYLGLILFLPQLLFFLISGHIADSYHRQYIILTTQSLEVILTLSLAWASYYQLLERETLFIAAFLVGTLRSFQGPAMQALLPTLVNRDLLAQAVSLGSASRQFATIAGPALGGLLYIYGATTVYLATCACFIIAILQIVQISTVNSVKQAPKALTKKALFAGAVFIYRHKLIWGAISLDLFSVLLGGATALLPIYADQILHTDSVGLGLLRAAPAIGAFVIAFYFAKHSLKSHLGKTMFAGVIGFGLMTLVFALSTHLWLSLLALTLMGAADMLSVVIRSSLIQLETPQEMRGRVGAINGIFIGASNQLGEFESGVTAAWWGVVPAVIVGGIGTLVIAAVWIRLFPELYQRQSLNE